MFWTTCDLICCFTAHRVPSGSRWARRIRLSRQSVATRWAMNSDTMESVWHGCRDVRAWAKHNLANIFSSCVFVFFLLVYVQRCIWGLMCRRCCFIVFVLGALIHCFCSASIITCRKEVTIASVVIIMTPIHFVVVVKWLANCWVICAEISGSYGNILHNFWCKISNLVWS